MPIASAQALLHGTLSTLSPRATASSRPKSSPCSSRSCIWDLHTLVQASGWKESTTFFPLKSLRATSPSF